jgi:hypothetical protein
MKSNEEQPYNEILQEQLLKYADFDSDGKLQKVEVSWSANVSWGGQIEVDYLDITEEDVKRGLTEEQCKRLSDAYTEENLQDEGWEQCDMDLELGNGAESINVDCDLLSWLSWLSS